MLFRKIFNTLKSKEYIKMYLIIIFIIAVRFFILEPFRIPSGSMKPSILIGDFVFVDKFSYGISIPFINKKIDINRPSRGDVIVFKKNDNINYIKRVIGIESDEILYLNKNLYLSNKLIKSKFIYKKINFKKKFFLLEKYIKKEYLSPYKEYNIQLYNNIDSHSYKFFNVIVPKDSYFVLGDNRDNSEDSRFWGFVNKKDIVGKALFIWMSIDYNLMDIRWNRIFKKIK